MKSLISLVGLTTALAISSAQGQPAPGAPSAVPQPMPAEAPSGVPVAEGASEDVLSNDALRVQEEVLRAQKDAQKQVVEAQKQLERSQRDQQETMLRTFKNGVLTGGGGGGYGIMSFGGGPAASTPLVVRSANADPKEDANLSEDLAVMAHILDKTVADTTGNEPRGARAMGITIFTQPDAPAPRHLYLEGYGALFLIDVNFPLLAPAQKAEEAKPSADSTWEEAKQELYGEPRETPLQGEPTESYSEEKVTKLKNALVDALKNSTNIRGLKPEETVTICVSGGPKAGGFKYEVISKFSNKIRGRGEDPMAPLEHRTRTASLGSGQRTIMTIQAKKLVIDQFAQSKIARDNFLKQVKIATYLGGATSGGNAGGIGGGGVGMGGMGGGMGRSSGVAAGAAVNANPATR